MVLVWAYFFAATFFTQLLFFNMLIAIMGTTYNRVLETSERSILKMKTKVLAEFIYVIRLGRRFKDFRYLYVAK
jgi:hypothetical protein